MKKFEIIEALKEALTEAYGTDRGYMKFYLESLTNEI